MCLFVRECVCERENALMREFVNVCVCVCACVCERVLLYNLTVQAIVNVSACQCIEAAKSYSQMHF
jgi:hypothetical protein